MRGESKLDPIFDRRRINAPRMTIIGVRRDLRFALKNPWLMRCAVELAGLENVDILEVEGVCDPQVVEMRAVLDGLSIVEMVVWSSSLVWLHLAPAGGPVNRETCSRE